MSTPALRGKCSVLYCRRVARTIDLALAQGRLESARRKPFRHKLRTPGEHGLPLVLRVGWSAPGVRVDGIGAAEEAEVSIYAQGVLCVTWTLPFEGELEELVRLSAQLYDHEELAGRSREVWEQVLAALGDSAREPGASRPVEDYVVFELAPVEGGATALLSEGREVLARVLRGEDGALSEQEVADALAKPVSYGPEDLCLIDWLAAFLMGADNEDERLLLELATVELLLMRSLAGQLDEEIQEAYGILTRGRGLLSLPKVDRRDIGRIARMQADSAVLLVGTDNPLELFGDDYLARLYRTAAERFHFDEQDAALDRKLGMLRDVYSSLADLGAHRRSEILEWIIILLIAVEIVFYFLPPR